MNLTAAMTGSALAQTFDTVGGHGAWPGFFCPADPMASARLARRRLLVAMAAASLLLAAILALDIELAPGGSDPLSGRVAPLSVDILPRAVERRAEPAAGKAVGEQAAETAPPAAPSARDEVQPAANDVAIHPEATVDAEPSRQWHSIARQVVRESAGGRFERERLREANWRQAKSSMFRPARAAAQPDEAPLLGDLKFRQPAGVFGLGLTFGSCFVGIPIAGIPVEERSVAIRLFYCRGDSG